MMSTYDIKYALAIESCNLPEKEKQILVQDITVKMVIPHQHVQRDEG